MSRTVSSEEKTWRTYSKSLIVELKEKLAARRARTLGLLSEGGDSSVFCEVDTESDGLDDTSSHSHEVKDRVVQDALDENEPETASLSETSSISDNMEFCNHSAEDAQQGTLVDKAKIMQTKRISFATIATDCHSFSPPRVDSTTMTSAKFRFEGDRELVSVGTGCDWLNESSEGSEILVTTNDVSNLDIDNISFEFPALPQIKKGSEAPKSGEHCTSAVAEIDSIEATYSSAVQYFFGSSQEKWSSLSKSTAITHGKSLAKKEKGSSRNRDFYTEVKNELPNDTLAYRYDRYLPNTYCSLEECKDITSVEDKRVTMNDLTPEPNESSTLCGYDEIPFPNISATEDMYKEESTKVGLEAGDFKLSESPLKTAKHFCSSLIVEAEELLRSELSLTTYGCAIEEILRVIKSDKVFYTEIDKNVVSLLENHLDQNRNFQYGDQNVSSNSGNDQFSFSGNESTSKEANIATFRKNQRLQSCLKKARLVSALQLNHDSATTKMGKVVTKQAYDKAVREFETLVARYASTDLNRESCTQPSQSKKVAKHPHVTSLPPFGASKFSISSKTFICDSKDDVDKNEENTDTTQSSANQAQPFVLEEDISKPKEKYTVNDANVSADDSLSGTPACVDSHPPEKKGPNSSREPSHCETNAHTKKGSLVPKEKKCVSGVDDSDSESEESHESGFCSNQIYTSSLLTQLLDYSSQEEDIADMEDVSKYHDLVEEQSGENVKDVSEPGILITRDSNDQINTDNIINVSEDGVKAQNGCKEKTSEYEMIVEDTGFDDVVVYESDFETGSDSDTTLKTPKDRKTKKCNSVKDEVLMEYKLSKDHFSNKTEMVETFSSINREDKAATNGQDIQDRSTKTDRVVSNVSLSSFLSFVDHLDTKLDKDESAPSNSADANISPAKCRKQDRNSQQHSSKKKMRPFLLKVDLSSSDDDSADDINNDLSPSEILRQRQIERVDGRLEQLKEIVKRKRKARSPHKQRLQKKEKTEVVFNSCSLQASDQSENRCAFIGQSCEDSQGYKDPKLLSSCLDLITRRRKLQENSKSLQDSGFAAPIASLEQGYHLNTKEVECDAHRFSAESYEENASCKESVSEMSPMAECNERFELGHPTDPDFFKNDLSAPEAPIEAGNIFIERSSKEAEIIAHIDENTGHESQKSWSTESEETKRKATEEKCVDETCKSGLILEAQETNSGRFCVGGKSRQIRDDNILNSAAAFVHNSVDPIEVNERNDDTKTTYRNRQLNVVKSTNLNNGRHGMHDTVDEALIIMKHTTDDSRSVSLATFSKEEASDNVEAESLDVSEICIDIIEKSENIGISMEKKEKENRHYVNNQVSSNYHLSPAASPRRCSMEDSFGGEQNISKIENLNSGDSQIEQEGTLSESQMQNGLDFSNQSVDKLTVELLTKPSSSLCNANEIRCTEDSSSKEAWQMIGSVNDFYKFLLESKAKKPNLKQNHVYCVCNPDHMQLSSFQQNGIMGLSKTLSPCILKHNNTAMIKENVVCENVSQQRYQSLENESGLVVFTEPKEHDESLLHNFKTAGDIHIMKRLEALENLLSDSTQCQEEIKNVLYDAMKRSNNSGPELIMAISDPENPSCCPESSDVPTGVFRGAGSYSVPMHGLSDTLVHTATQTSSVATQACQTENGSFEDKSLELKNSLQSFMHENLRCLQDKVEIIESEVKARSKEYDVSASKLDEIEQIMKDRYDDMNRRALESQNYLDGKLEGFKNAISLSVESSIGAWREILTENIKGQMRDMSQAMKTELVESTRQAYHELSVDITAFKESLERHNRIKELTSASTEKRSVGDEWKSPQVNKGMDVDTMKLRIVELTSQRDAEKVFHKITRQALRALERDHERLREEYLGARLGRDRKAADTDHRRNFKHFISQQCSYCFNNNRCQVERQKDDKRNLAGQRDSSNVLPNPSQICSIRREKSGRTSEAFESTEQSDVDCQQSECNDPTGCEGRNERV
ncbi:hypothetical protein RRG08_026469 [Elysia crispata]|uniref:Uncharacterized protein n=1 Tax=Elysia crispata TaxID=231223 RepID=A0AAE0Y4U8_9GAST|nr:hypothetical protein RRG08_026469 [Elysia crispata]